MGIRKELAEVEKEYKGKEKEGIIEGKLREEQLWRIMGIYVNGGMERKLEELKDWMEKKDTGIKTIIGGNFNGARTGTRGGWKDMEEGEGGTGEADERQKAKWRRKEVGGVYQ